MVGEYSQLPEQLFPREVAFDGGKSVINYLPETTSGLDIHTVGFLPLDVARAREQGFEEWNDPRYALRGLHKESFGGKIKAQMFTTTMGLYNRFHRTETAEDLRNLELAMPVGGCAVLLTTEKDGSHRMVLQYRVHKDEYAYTPGVAAGGIIAVHYDEHGQPKPLEAVYRDHIATRLKEEAGVTGEFDMKIIAAATERVPKAHQEIISLVTVPYDFDELIQSYCLQHRTMVAPLHLISLPADPSVIETLVAQLDCPLPPTHNNAYVAAGYMLILEKSGVKAAQDWKDQLQTRVQRNYDRIDEVVRISGRGDQYRPYSSPISQGLPDLLMALWKANLLQPVRTAREAELSQEQVNPAEVCITGSVFFPKYGSDGSDTQRGDLALDAIRSTLEAGYKMAVVVAPATADVYKKKLEEIQQRDTTNSLLLLVEEGKTYSGARRQAMREALLQLHSQYVVSCEIEKKELLKFYQNFLQPFQRPNPPGLVVMDRGIFEDNPNLPWAQDWGEMHQNRAIMRHLVNAGLMPEGSEPLDLLNGTRVALDKELPTNVGISIKPTDVMMLKYEYEGEQPVFPYGVDHYSAAVYHSPTMLMALGVGVEQVRVPYIHDESQRALEEGEQREKFEKKRIDQARAIIDQNFDLVASILEWKKEGKWPQIVVDAIRNKTPLPVRHFDSRRYSLTSQGIVDKGE